MHHTPSPPSRSLPFFFHPCCPKSLKSHWRHQSGSLSLLIRFLFLIEEEKEEVVDRRGGCISRLGVRASLWACRQVSWSSPHSGLPPPLTIPLSVSITEGWLTAWINPCSSRHVLGPYQLGTGPWALMRKLVQGNWISFCVWDFIDCY